MNKILKLILLIMLISGSLVTGCSSDSTPSTPTEGTQVGDLAPDFQYQDADGQSASFSDFRGKSVLINFWATWCSPCVYEMPYIQQVYNEWSGNGLVVVAINVGDSPSQVGEFMQSQGLSLPVLLDRGRSIAQKYNIQYFPSTFFIDKDGIIQEVKVGAFSSAAEIESRLSKIIP